MDPNARNQQAADAGAIDLRLSEISQLFQSMDPSPVTDRELDARAEDYIVDWATELPRQAALKLTIHLPEPPGLADAQDTIAQSIQNFFRYRAGQIARQHRELIRQGWKDLAIGLVFLFTCLLAARLLNDIPDRTLIAVLRESLIIGGWVAMWRPLETFLYSRWPLRRRQALYERLARMQVQLRSGVAPGARSGALGRSPAAGS
jgi:hypothetical protein